MDPAHLVFWLSNSDNPPQRGRAHIQPRSCRNPLWEPETKAERRHLRWLQPVTLLQKPKLRTNLHLCLVLMVRRSFASPSAMDPLGRYKSHQTLHMGQPLRANIRLVKDQFLLVNSLFVGETDFMTSGRYPSIHLHSSQNTWLLLGRIPKVLCFGTLFSQMFSMQMEQVISEVMCRPEAAAWSLGMLGSLTPASC